MLFLGLRGELKEMFQDTLSVAVGSLLGDITTDIISGLVRDILFPLMMIDVIDNSIKTEQGYENQNTVIMGKKLKLHRLYVRVIRAVVIALFLLMLSKYVM